MKKENVKLRLTSSTTAETEILAWSPTEKSMHLKIAKRIKEKSMDLFEYTVNKQTTKIDKLETLAKFVKEVYKIDSEAAEDKAAKVNTLLSHKHSHPLKCRSCGKYFDSMNKITYTGSNGLQGVSECPHCSHKVHVTKTDQAEGYTTQSDGSFRRAEPKQKMSKKARRKLRRQ